MIVRRVVPYEGKLPPASSAGQESANGYTVYFGADVVSRDRPKIAYRVVYEYSPGESTAAPSLEWFVEKVRNYYPDF